MEITSSGKKKSWFDNEIAIKKKTPILVCILALLVFFSYTTPLSAHDYDPDDIPIREDGRGSHSSDSVTAGDVPAGDMEKMRDFMLHAMDHVMQFVDYNTGLAPFLELIQEEGGDWKNGTIYLWRMSQAGEIQNHPHYPIAQNGNLNNLPVMQQLIEGVKEDKPVREDESREYNYGVDCKPYTFEGEARVACAAKFRHPVWQSDLILLAGYHVHDIHDEEDEEEVGFDQIQCPYFVSDIIDQEPYFKQGISANKVVDSDNLKEFVNEFAKHFGEQIEVGQNPAQLAKIRNCWRSLPWKYGAVYVFIMTENNLVFFNGNGPHLENRSFDVRDDNEFDVGNEVIRIIRGEVRQCKDLGLLPEESGGFVQYLWDDPTDDVPPRIEEGRSPGDVPKLSYVVSFSNNDFLGGEKLIIGSGFHPRVSDDDGCAIAGAGSTAKGTVFNLFLIVLVLFSAALWRKRSGGKQI